MLDFLVFSFQLFSREDFKNYKKHAEILQRLFTSYMYDRLNPQKHNEQITKNTLIKSPKEISINEFLEDSPEALYALLPVDNKKENWYRPPLHRNKKNVKNDDNKEFSKHSSNVRTCTHRSGMAVDVCINITNKHFYFC